MSITFHVNMSVALEGAAPASAGFGVPMFVYEHSVTANRQDGPYSSLAELVAAGFTSGSAVHTWATALLSQQPKVSQFMVGRRDSGDADLTASLDAIEAVDPSTWYCTCIATRTATDIEDLAAWTETRKKIAMVQSNDASILSGDGPQWTVTPGGTATDGDYDVVFTGFGLVAPVTVTVTRSTTPATNDDLATAIAAAIEAEGDLDDIVALAAADGSVVTIDIEDGLAVGTITTTPPSPATLTAAVVDADIASLLYLLGYTRTALWYHPTDAHYLDGAVTGRCLAFALDLPDGAGIWAYKRVSGVAATQLTTAQKTAMRAVNCNFYAPVRASSGTEITGFTFKGTMASGRSIDITTSLDWANARLEEALMGVLLGTTTKIPFTDAGLGTFQAAGNGVLQNGVANGHFAGGAVSATTGRSTPYIDVPKVSDISSADKQLRKMTMTGEAVLAGAIESIGDSATVGFTLNVSF